MKSSSFFSKASSFLRSHAFPSKLMVLLTLSSTGGLVAYSDPQTETTPNLELNQKELKKEKKKEDIADIFKAADKDNSGTLTVKEFQDVIEDIVIRYPQVDLYLKSKHLRDVTDLLRDPEGHEQKEVDIEGFKFALSHVDSQMKSLPATAQVAAQQGAYLSHCFNRREKCEKNPEGPQRFKGSGRHAFRPFEYKHLGQFAPLGGEQTAAELPGDWVSMGHSTQWLWYSVYASKQVSWRTRVLVVSDWTRRFLFGRDSSRI
ncbi:hypothetical protein SAY87_001404 [Trapa incisa]|uniref:NADH:ubiquinone reductase (non-electrogenic) n=1 Tax=Trapa incisa TaxID=236973 RepID=A0AAN7GNH9_9MYRT|nr:hypothetical protein SAY87_001404 [Trapa incisa]